MLTIRPLAQCFVGKDVVNFVRILPSFFSGGNAPRYRTKMCKDSSQVLFSSYIGVQEVCAKIGEGGKNWSANINEISRANQMSHLEVTSVLCRLR